MTNSYDDLTSRNHTYIPEDTQKQIRSTRLLIAGVGMGSTVAEAAVRTGFENITLIDKDTVASHNLNRQNFTSADVDKSKVNCLAQRLREINPNAKIQEFDEWLTPENATSLVSNADFIFDTIDFLSMEAIVALHDECKKQKKPIISLASAGFGAMAITFLPGNPHSIREFFGLAATGPVDNESYSKCFANLFWKLSDQMDPQMVEAMKKTFATMEDSTPCPAPHLAIGANTMAALGMTLVSRILQGKPVKQAPDLILLNFNDFCNQQGINLAKVASK